MDRSSRLTSGFTLIELLIAIAILGLLLGVAVPSYRDFITRSYLGEAFDNLSTFRVSMEQAYQDNGNYGGAGACSVANPTSASFNYGCALGAGGQTFVATATGSGANGITGYTYTINESGDQATTAFPSGSVPATCWLTNTSGC